MQKAESGITTTRHAAPGQNAGFDYQYERALKWLACSPSGFLVGIETDDDVAVRGSDGSQLLEQDKHSIRDTAEPFGNRSKDLWNTLAIWLDALEAKTVSPESTTFLMATNRALSECIAVRIGQAQSEEEALECISALEIAGASPSQAIAPFVVRVVGKKRRELLKSLILRCELADGSQKNSEPELRKEIVGYLQLPDWCIPNAESILQELLGWLHITVSEAWLKGSPAWVQRDHFVNCLHAVIGRRRRQIVRERAENLIPVTNEKVGQQRGRPFVKQMHLVTDDEAIVDGAIRDFIRCNIEKGRLSVEGNITDDDWLAFEAALLSRWERIRARVLRMRKSDPEEDVGFTIYTDTTEAHREKLAGSDTDQVYLTAGMYHRLSDLIRVGWHPRFEELLEEPGTKP